MRLRAAMLFVKDLERMTDFYAGVLGLLVVAEESERGMTVLDAGGARLALHQIPPELADMIVIADPPTARESTPIKLIFEVDDVSAESERLTRAGATMLAPRPWGTCDGLDPEGNVFQLASRA